MLAHFTQKVFGWLRFKRMHQLMVGNFLVPYIGGFSISLFILVIQFLSKVQDQIFGKGLPAGVMLQLFFFACVVHMIFALPLGMLFTSLMTMGKMGENYELAALKASGISLTRVLRPLAAFALGITGFALALSLYIIPKSNLKFFSLLYDVRQAKPKFTVKPGVFNANMENYVIRAGGQRPADGMLYDVRLYDHSELRGAVKWIEADSGRIVIDHERMWLRMVLYNGLQHEEPAPTGGNPAPYTRLYFDTLRYKIDMSDFRRTPENLFSSHQYMLTLGQLTDTLRTMGREPARLVAEVRQTVEPTLRLGALYQADSLRRAGRLPATVRPLAEVAPLATLQDSINVVNTALATARSLRSSLANTGQRADQAAETARKYEIQWHKKFTLPLACLLFLFIGAPLGAIIRKGGLGMPVVVSVLFFIIFYVLINLGERMAKEGAVAVWFGVWLPIIVMLPMALYLTYQSTTDSRLFDLSAWAALPTRLGLRRERAGYVADTGRLRRLPAASAALDAPPAEGV